MIRTILFDLDGTLLPVDQETFTKHYFTILMKKLIKYGVDPERMTKAIWDGTKAMILNQGDKTNEKVFFENFTSKFGYDAKVYEPIFLDFYTNEFDQVKAILGPQQGQRKLVEGLKTKGYTVVLATNPVFPECAVETRLQWIDLHLTDFDYVTTYENSHYCKPNPDYFREVLSAIGSDAKETLMVGNNTVEDVAAQIAGCQIFLVTDYLENQDKFNKGAIQSGTYEEVLEFLQALPVVKA